MSQKQIDESNNRFIDFLQSRITILETDLRITNMELEHAKRERDQYKQRCETMKLMMDGYNLELEETIKNQKK